ncbi:hypothetical protein NLJ89_g1594 [Agrocybe chaxingu]|uniref:MYND-type domain-containing protein n=1 Tax=Agrocybe chaxingu TaxID=84603 RepID=A0A9W8MZS0_9AGAR|nr:hypothetical protein NLJ89_g1594 [Agrocybe chaxingu]
MAPSDIPREDLLVLLESIGVPLPKETKLQSEELQKRLTQALDAAQEFQNVFGSKTVAVDPTEYPLWSLEKTLLEATRRGNMIEAFRNSLKLTRNPPPLSTEKKDTFIEMRQIVMTFANWTDQNTLEFALMDSSRAWGVYVRMLEARNVKDTPLFVLAFKELHSNGNDLVEIVRTHMCGLRLANVHTTELERRAMLKLFRMNAKRLPADFRHPKLKDARKTGLKVSFVLPLGPLSMQHVGKLTNNPGCEVCGKENTSRCLQCLAAAYCGRECQTADWPNHKKTCRSLKGGSWSTITFEKEGSRGLRLVVNKMDSPAEIKARNQVEGRIEGSSPPNVHADKVFLVKIQISAFAFGDEANMLIYDRQRSFQVTWLRNSDPDLFDEVEEIIGDPLKMYRAPFHCHYKSQTLRILLAHPPAELDQYFPLNTKAPIRSRSWSNSDGGWLSSSPTKLILIRLWTIQHTLQEEIFTSLFGQSYTLRLQGSESSNSRPSESETHRECVGIASLPVELLSIIFNLLALSTRAHKLPIVHYKRHIKKPRTCDCVQRRVRDFEPRETDFPYAQEKVCRRWRDILSTNPSFWTRVVVSLVPGEYTPPERFANYLRWSRDLPIEVYIGDVCDSLRHPDESALLQTYTDILRPHFHRCQVLRFSFKQRHFKSLPRLVINKDIFPVLKCFIFKIQDDTPDLPSETIQRFRDYIEDNNASAHTRPWGRITMTVVG